MAQISQSLHPNPGFECESMEYIVERFEQSGEQVPTGQAEVPAVLSYDEKEQTSCDNRCICALFSCKFSC